MLKKLAVTVVLCASVFVGASAFAQEAPPTTTTATTTENLEATPTAAFEQAAVSGGEVAVRGAPVQIIAPPARPDAFTLPADSGNGRRVVYSKSQQTVWALDENNEIIKMHRVSGRQDPFDPAPGVYSVYSRSRFTFAPHNPSIIWGYMVRFAHGSHGGNIGFHDIPTQYGSPVQTPDELGQALSGGCVRQLEADAVWMWNWAQLGTVVVVTP